MGVWRARVCGSRPVIAAGARSRRLGTRVSKEPARSGLRRELVLVDQPAEQVTAAQAIEVDHVGEWLPVAERRPLAECPVRAMLVEMPDVRGEHVVEVAAAEDQQSVEALVANAADPAFSVRSRLRRPYRRFDHLDAFAAKDLVEVTSELAVAVTNEKPRPDIFVVELHQEVACLLGHPAAIRIGRDPGEVDAPGRKLDEEQRVEALQEERVDGKEVTLQDARRLSPQELPPALLEPLRCRLDPCLLQNRPDGACGQLDPEPEQLALDPPVAPARVLPRQPHHERTHLGASRWASGTPMRIRPAARDQLAMPTHKRRRRDEHRRLPALP